MQRVSRFPSDMSEPVYVSSAGFGLWGPPYTSSTQLKNFVNLFLGSPNSFWKLTLKQCSRYIIYEYIATWNHKWKMLIDQNHIMRFRYKEWKVSFQITILPLLQVDINYWLSRERPSNRKARSLCPPPSNPVLYVSYISMSSLPSPSK